MRSKISYIIVICMIFCNCTSESIDEVSNLQELIDIKSYLKQDEVIACAASKKDEEKTSFIFYYPIPSATNIQYFESESVNIDKDDYSLYKPIELKKEAVFNGYLERFVREGTEEVWCIVTYQSNGKFHKSNPIRLKHQTKPTEWSDNVTIDNSDSLQPKFIWNDGNVKENAIYFQVISDVENDFISGTYTYDKWFQYYNLSNVVLNITRKPPPSLTKGNNYNFTMMGVSEDNWVNLVLQKKIKAE